MLIYKEMIDSSVSNNYNTSYNSSIGIVIPKMRTKYNQFYILFSFYIYKMCVILSIN